MKRFFLGIVVMFLLAAGQVQRVKADVILEPQDNFWARHRKECMHIERRYTANGEIFTWKAPNSFIKTGTLDNQTVLNVSFIYTDKNGVDWGFVKNKEWILLADTVLVYDSRQFLEDYADEIISAEEVRELKKGSKVIFWTYPQSGKIKIPERELSDDVSFDVIYTDEEGREWGYRSYYQGIRDFWVCFSELNKEDIPAKEFPSDIPGQKIEKEKIDEVKENNRNTVKLVTLILAVVLTAVMSGILIWMFWIKKKNS